MTIPASQLNTWTNIGATVGAQNAHTSVRTALSSHTWPTDMSYSTYLQGSYANSTNVRGDSDVDLVGVTDSIFYFDLNDDERRRLGIQPAPHSWADFRREALAALQAYYGADTVEPHSKCIRVKGSSGRLPVDLVVAAEYKNYQNGFLRATGIVFWANQGSGARIINYPRLHHDRGASKNQLASQRFKPTVRMFKNARASLNMSADAIRTQYPSYFVECLLYNAPNGLFTYDVQDTFLGILRWLVGVRDGNQFNTLLTQSEQHYLIGSHEVQWPETNARSFIEDMIDLWNNWS